jgi:hypothetical protein
MYIFILFSFQMLVQRLGDEARDILESDIGMDRLTVPRSEALLRREGKHFCFFASCCFILNEPDVMCLINTYNLMSTRLAAYICRLTVMS